MRFIAQRDTMLKPLLLTSGVVERRQTLPILSNVLLNIRPDGLSLTATDLEVEMIFRVPVDSSGAGEVTLPARKLLDIFRALPEGAKVDISVDSDKAVVRSGRSRFTLATLPATEFPTIDAASSLLTLEVPRDTLKTLIERTQFAMAQQDVRYYLNGLLLEIGDKQIRTVATDGHRLALCELPIEGLKNQENQQFIIPRKGVQELGRLLDGSSESVVSLVFGTNFIRLVTPEFTFTSKLVDGRFPDYQRVLPQGGDKNVVIDRNTLREALIRAAILSNEKYRSIRFELNSGNAKIFAHNPEQEEAEEDIEVNYQGDSLEIGFNVHYILEAINAIDKETVELLMSDANSCCLIQGTGSPQCRYVVMPMRI